MYDAAISRSDASATMPEDVANAKSPRRSSVAAVSSKPWSTFSPADYPTAANYCGASLINENTGPAAGWTKGSCKLPVREPDGTLNRNAVFAAAARLAGAGGGVDSPAAMKRAAAAKLVGHYRTIGEIVPPAIAKMASYT